MTSYSSWRDIPKPIRAFIIQFLNANGDMKKVTASQETLTEVIRQNILVLGKYDNIYMDANIIKLFNERNNTKHNGYDYPDSRTKQDIKILGLDQDIIHSKLKLN